MIEIAPTMQRRGALVLITWFGVAGCGGAVTPPAENFVVDTLPSGRVVVTNDGTGVWTPETAWMLEEDLRLGRLDGGGPEQFAEIYWITTDTEGRIYVVENLDQEIRVFEPDGSYARTIGGKGEGPGEFRGAVALNWAPDGSFWVTDYGNRRFSRFTPSGEFVDSWIRRTRGVIFPWNGGFVGDQWIDWGLDRVDEPGPDRGFTMLYPIAFDPPDSYDTLPRLDFMQFKGPGGRRLYGRNKGVMLAQTPDGHIWFAHTDDYTLYKRTMEGDTLLEASIPNRKSIITDAQIDSMIRRSREMGDPRDLQPDFYVRERRLVTRVLYDGAGHVYAMPEEEGVPEGTVIDVFDESGVYLGRMEFGEKVLTLAPPPHVTRNHVYGVVLDGLDVPYLVRWRIVRPTDGASR